MSTDGLNNGPSPADNPDSASGSADSQPFGRPSAGSQPAGSPSAGSRPDGSQSYASELDRPGAPSELDYEADPLLRLERNNKSTRQAIWFFVGVIVSTTLSAILIWIASKVIGGPYCEADSSAQLCSRTFQLLFSIVPTSIAFFGLFGSAFITYYKWKNHQRWRPWVAVIWFIMPFCMAWITSVGAYLLIDHSL
ncbi:hypothetical protein ACN4D1_07280 [Corynebacterium macclintockiae]|uniref:Uncharacterized protein n=1 Tax=Corynebacterium macclintockiae TaxID=2913501 RepID=A0A9X3RRK0_9CORY|nr:MULTISPECIES: hypothetical protein [Corynebacterium]MBC6794849.1 hypothetical protein [Corynebacterium sp. LK28]MCZ9305151.1 hypothetical protein [Corynebacterium macclintockiae]OFM60132.1 hypothetical protein HMPREF2678_04840 [Corynebacterium sp. HMSC058E07]